MKMRASWKRALALGALVVFASALARPAKAGGIGADTIALFPKNTGEFGYVDAQGRVLCRLDLLQADFSKVTAQTVNALLIVEGTAAHDAEVLRRGFAEAVELVTRHCGGTAEVVALPQE